ALLRWGGEKDWSIDWSQLFGDGVASWQVDRSDFDHVLLEHAAEEGVDVRQGAEVRSVRFVEDRPRGAEWVDAEGELHVAEFDVLVDASGRSGVLSAQHFRNRRRHEIFRNVAVWGYWTGGRTLPNTPSGGIDIISHPEGWYWVIPLRGGRHSVGFVTHRTNFQARRPAYPDNQAMLLDLVAESPTVTELLSDGAYEGKAHVEQDYSYVADSFCGPGYYLVGDAACFLDPLLSTGVHLSLYSGMLAAAAILARGRGEVAEREAQAFYESLFRNAYARLLVLVCGVYEQYAGKESYFWLAQRMVRKQERSSQQADASFTEVISGLSDLHDAGTTGGAVALTELIEEAQRAQEKLNDAEDVGGSGDSPVYLAPLRLSHATDLGDLYDAASGLYLVTTPRLGIGRDTPIRKGNIT
ncbi:NAD(P)/FAD-dependent oxidoreductase, partial [Streptomyces wedmorensis]|uniref:NAD(P)/FAD-dependent oxidoreductase n=1 Tax=Streptomyces wedmorensis TaxID=43759 RepID=UPI00378AD45D